MPWGRFALARKDLPGDDLNRLSAQHVLAMAYEADGKVKDAIQLFEHIVGTQGRKLTEDESVPTSVATRAC